MGIVCSICNKKQSGFISDFPLSNDLLQHRLCVKCYGNKEKLSSCIQDKDIDKYEKSKRYFKLLMDNSNINKDAGEYLKGFISKLDKEYDIILKSKQLEDQEKEKEKQLEQVEKEKTAIIERDYNQLAKEILMTTGYNFDGYKIKKYIKVISSESVLGTGFLSKFTAEFADLFGVESEKSNNKLQEARNYAT